MVLLLLALACAPKPASPAVPATEPVVLPVAAAEEQAAFETLSRNLAEQEANTGIAAYGHGADLADALVEGVADPEVRAAAIDLLEWLATTDLGEPPEAPEVDTGLDPLGALAEARATSRAAEVWIPEARERLRRGDYRGAIEALRPLQGTSAWEDARPYWEEAVDLYVAEERERAGQMYIDARGLKGAARRAALLEVRDVLAGLLDEFPDSAYTDPLRENLERVERALESGAD